MSPEFVKIPYDRVAARRRQNGSARLSLFGSILRDEFRPNSDVDMLVEFHPGACVGYLVIARMTRELSEILGRQVDLRTAAELNPSFRSQVIGEVFMEYVAA
jgi:predicted nucleotidyltransferase